MRIFVTGLILILSHVAVAEDRLLQIARTLEQDPTIEHIDIPSVVENMSQPGNTQILFDVRTKEEFAVSHLPNAIRLDPDMDPRTFLDEYGDLLEQNQVLFYCSVGRRSTQLAERVTKILV